jgi:hypothetical protein
VNSLVKSTKTDLISVSYNDMVQLYQAQNDLKYYYTNNGNYTMNIGTVDYENAQTWTMPTFPLIAEPTGDGISIENAVGEKYFPTATHCRQYNYTDGVDTENFYEYYQFTDTAITLLGFIDTIPTQQWGEHDFYNELVTPLPLDINTDFITESEIQFRDTIYSRTQEVYTEGYGTLTTALGNEDVLKVRADVSETIYDLNYNIIDESLITYFTFFSKQGTRLILELEEGSITSGNVNIVNVQFERVIQNPNSVQHIQNTKQQLFYPNPTNGKIWFNQTSNYNIYSISGTLVKSINNSKSTDVSDLQKGIYILKKSEGKNQKLIIQ